MLEDYDLPRNHYVSDLVAAQILGLSRSYLRQMRVSGNGPAFSKLGGRAIRYRVGDLFAWAGANARTSTSQD